MHQQSLFYIDIFNMTVEKHKGEKNNDVLMLTISL
jgi:hypothetical protein